MESSLDIQEVSRASQVDNHTRPTVWTVGKKLFQPGLVGLQGSAVVTAVISWKVGRRRQKVAAAAAATASGSGFRP